MFSCQTLALLSTCLINSDDLTVSLDTWSLAGRTFVKFSFTGRVCYVSGMDEASHQLISYGKNTEQSLLKELEKSDENVIAHCRYYELLLSLTLQISQLVYVLVSCSLQRILT